MSKTLNKRLECAIKEDREHYTKGNGNLHIFEYVNSLLIHKDFLKARGKELKESTKFREQITNTFLLFGAFLTFAAIIFVVASGILHKEVSCAKITFLSFLLCAVVWFTVVDICFDKKTGFLEEDTYMLAFALMAGVYSSVFVVTSQFNLNGLFLFAFLLWILAIVIAILRIAAIRKKLVGKVKSAKKAEIIKDTYDKLARLRRMIPYMQNVELINSTEAIECFVAENYKKFE